MDDYIIKASKSIDQTVDTFHKRATKICENGPFRKARRISTTFPMLKLGNEEFYEYTYIERTLEWYVRDFLNDAIHELFAIHRIETVWQDNKNYVRYS